MATLALVDPASEDAIFIQLLSTVWVDLSMVAMAAVVYVALSAKRIPAKLPGKSRAMGLQRRGAPIRGSSSNSLHAAHVGGAHSRRLMNKKRTFQIDDQASDSVQSSQMSQGDSSPKSHYAEVAAQAKAIRTCGKKGDLASALSIYARLRQSGHGTNNLVFNSLLDTCVACGNLGEAEKYFEQAKERKCVNVVSFNTMMKGYLAQKDVERAEGLLQELAARGLTATQASYHGLIQHRLQVGDRLGAWKMVDEMESRGLNPNSKTGSIMLRGAMNAHEAEVCRVLKMIQVMSTPIDGALFSTVVEACLKIDRVDYLSAVRSKCAEQGEPLGLTAPVYCSMIRAYGKAHDVSTVWSLWNEMLAHQVTLTPIALGCMVEALVANRKPEDARQVVDGLWAAESLRGLVNTVVYSTIIKGFANKRQPDCVMSLYAEMNARRIRPNHVTYNTILNAFAQCKAMHRVPQLLKEMREADPPMEPDIVTYSTIVKGYCSAGSLDEALDLFKAMKATTSIKPDEVAYNCLLDGCAKQLQFDAALELVRDMNDAGIPASNYTLSILIKLMGRCKKIDQAFETVDMFRGHYGVKLNLQVYTCLIQGCFNNRQPDRAFAVHEQMLREGIELDEKAYTTLLRGCLHAGALDKAVHIVRCAYGMVEVTRATPGVEQRSLEELISMLGPHSEVGSALAREVFAASGRNVSTCRRSCRGSARQSDVSARSSHCHWRRQ